MPTDFRSDDDLFVAWYHPAYHADHRCDDCDRFREIVGLEVGEEFDEESYDLVDISEHVSNECAMCGDEDADIPMPRGARACSDCWDRTAIIYCTNCEDFKFHAGGDEMPWARSVNSGNDTVCYECVNEGRVPSVSCPQCDRTNPEGAVEYHEVNYMGDTIEVCQTCYNDFNPCNECEVSFFADEMTHLRSGNYVCQVCLDEYFYTCEVCGESARDLSDCRCPETGIFNYGFTPNNLRFHTAELEKRNKKTLFFGVEVEVAISSMEDRTQGSRWIIRNWPHLFYCKNDSSISCGFELVSHPFTYRWFRENIEDIDTVFRRLRKIGYNPDRTCGMHVHMSKDAFSRIHLLKFMKLVYPFPHLIQTVSEREDVGQLSSYGALHKERIDGLVKKARNKNGNANGAGRSVAVNVTTSDTVEIRVFQSTLSLPTFTKNLEFLKALFEFSRTHSLEEMHEIHFLKWVKKNAKRFSKLDEFLRRNYRVGYNL